MLPKLLEVANKTGIFAGIKLPHCDFKLTHLQYVDDVILFIDKDEASIRGAKRVLQYFELLSVLHIYFNKSSLFGFGDYHNSLPQWASILGYEVGISKLVYLGTEIGISPISIKYWDLSLLKIRNRFMDWNADHLSIARRLVLLKASIDSQSSL